MSLVNYMKDKIMVLLLHIICMCGSGFFLYACGLGKDQLILFYVAWITIAAVYFLIDWYRRRNYFREINKIMSKLDKPYLIGEVMPDSWRLEDQEYRKIIRFSNKSVIDAIHHQEMERLEYKEFIENWIHEVKLPITAMNLVCDNHRTEETRKIKAQLSQVENDVEKALFYARSDRVYQDYLVREINLKEVILQVIRRNKTYLIQSGMQIDIQAEAETVYCDEKWLEFILNQLVSNAVKYRRESGGRLVFQTRAWGKGLCLVVEDNGIGIRDSELGRVFEKGFTGTNGRQNRQSTGIGLYLCQKLCRKLGISIDAESEEGKYTRMLLYFPDGRDHFSR